MTETKKKEEEKPETVRPQVHKANAINTAAAHKFWEDHGVKVYPRKKDTGREQKR